MMAAVAAADEANPTTDGPSSEGEKSEQVPGMAEWKDTYESYLSHWHAESAEARKIALATRERIEKQRAEEKKAAEDKVKAEKAALKAQEKKAKDAEKLKEEVEGKKAKKEAGGSGKEERDQKVKEAWEMVKGDGEGQSEEVVADARGVTAQDVAGGQALAPGQSRPAVKQASRGSYAVRNIHSRMELTLQTAYDPTTSTEPLPPSMTGVSGSAPTSRPAESLSQSRQSTTSQNWENISGPSSSSPDAQSSESEDLVKVSRPRPSKAQAAAEALAPVAPPSLTLSLFTMPGHLSVGRVLAVLGINLVLPFVNGVMLGFGEIFAREVVRAGRVWYHGGGSFVASLFGRGNGRGVGGVGLNGSGGF